MVSRSLVLPGSIVSGTQLDPPSTDTSHCTSGVGTPEAEAEKLADLPTATSTLDGWWVIRGASGRALTVSVAASLVTVATVFLNTARYLEPLCDSVAELITSAVFVAPVMLLHEEDPFGSTCHWTSGEGTPRARASNTAFSPTSTAWLSGCSITTGASLRGLTTSVAAADVTDPTMLENTARYSLPLSAATVGLVIVSCVVLAPESLVS